MTEKDTECNTFELWKVTTFVAVPNGYDPSGAIKIADDYPEATLVDMTLDKCKVTSYPR